MVSTRRRQRRRCAGRRTPARRRSAGSRTDRAAAVSSSLLDGDAVDQVDVVRQLIVGPAPLGRLIRPFPAAMFSRWFPPRIVLLLIFHAGRPLPVCLRAPQVPRPREIGTRPMYVRRDAKTLYRGARGRVVTGGGQVQAAFAA